MPESGKPRKTSEDYLRTLESIPARERHDLMYGRWPEKDPTMPDNFDASALMIAIDLVEAGGMPEQAEQLRELVRKEEEQRRVVIDWLNIENTLMLIKPLVDSIENDHPDSSDSSDDILYLPPAPGFFQD